MRLAKIVCCGILALVSSLYIHEFGHYSMAKLAGFDVSEFVIGKNGFEFVFAGTNFSIGLPIPTFYNPKLMGYVKIRGIRTLEDIKSMTVLRKLFFIFSASFVFLPQLLFLLVCYYRIFSEFDGKVVGCLYIFFFCLMCSETDFINILLVSSTL